MSYDKLDEAGYSCYGGWSYVTALFNYYNLFNLFAIATKQEYWQRLVSLKTKKHSISPTEKTIYYLIIILNKRLIYLNTSKLCDDRMAPSLT